MKRCVTLIMAGAIAIGCGDDDDDEVRFDAGDQDAGPDAGQDAAIDAGPEEDAAMDGATPDAAQDAAAGEDADADDDAGMDDEAEARLIEVIATEYDFNPSTIYAQPGQSVILRLRNEGTMPHDIEFELPDGDVGLEDNVPAPGAAQVRFTVPADAGEYTYYCPIGNHRELGMEGTLVVRQPPTVRLESLAEGLVSPVAMAIPSDDSGRIFIVDQIGLIRILEDGELLEQPFLDLRDQIVSLDDTYDERGLLGLALHPEFADNGRFFVHYSAPLRDEAPDDWNNTAHISEFQVSSGDENQADPVSERVLLMVDQPQSNHAGGTVAFGPDDGYLYIALGDGGGAGDIGMGHTPELGNGQDTSNLLGSILRIDVDGAEPYAIPADNPFVDEDPEDEIFAYGFRNPYRFSFDAGGDNALFAGDAGQSRWEEVSLVESGGNYGWHILEGTHCFDPEDFDASPATCSSTGPRGQDLLWPVIEVPNAELQGGLGTAIVGGYVYRGDELASEMQGRYVFGLFSAGAQSASGELMVASDVDEEEEDLWPAERLAVEGGFDHLLKGFGQDQEGGIYVLVSDQSGPTGNSGQVLRMRPPE